MAFRRVPCPLADDALGMDAGAISDMCVHPYPSSELPSLTLQTQKISIATAKRIACAHVSPSPPLREYVQKQVISVTVSFENPLPCQKSNPNHYKSLSRTRPGAGGMQHAIFLPKVQITVARVTRYRATCLGNQKYLDQSFDSLTKNTVQQTVQ
jgi:hypothetical protein